MYQARELARFPVPGQFAAGTRLPAARERHRRAPVRKEPANMAATQRTYWTPGFPHGTWPTQAGTPPQLESRAAFGVVRVRCSYLAMRYVRSPAEFFEDSIGLAALLLKMLTKPRTVGVLPSRSLPRFRRDSRRGPVSSMVSFRQACVARPRRRERLYFWSVSAGLTLMNSSSHF